MPSKLIKFCQHYNFHFFNLDIATVCLNITHLNHHFQSSRSVWNYMSSSPTLHKKLGLAPTALESFQSRHFFTQWTSHAVSPSMQTPHLTSAAGPSVPANVQPEGVGPGSQSLLDLCLLCHVEAVQPGPTFSCQFRPLEVHV